MNYARLAKTMTSYLYYVAYFHWLDKSQHTVSMRHGTDWGSDTETIHEFDHHCQVSGGEDVSLHHHD